MKITDLPKTKTLILVIVAALITIMGLVNFIQKQHSKTDIYSVKIFETGNGWGYSVLVKKKEVIRQEFIPAISKQHAFFNKKDALTVAEFVAGKLKENKIPRVTVEELKSLGIQLP